MASDQQVALARPHRMPPTSTHISKAARQVVPAFLQKLYEMVNDLNNAELIRWSETGDSFFVLDHERFAHEVLGRWFKHRNFSSFVRQLNMYGFHKIPHLQQGVLKSDTDTEFWNFAHANFHRGQPDLLCLIQRKKQALQPGDESAVELRDGNTGVGLVGGSNEGSASGGNATVSNGQVIDMHSILNGINVIKRHQTTISAELNELKRSNQLLWQDSLAARARHQKQQDTINRIVKFLAGVFGNHAPAGAGGVSVSGGPPNVAEGQHGNPDGVDGALGGTRKRVRLMIEDAKKDGTKSMIEELTEIPIEPDTPMQYIAGTPISIPSPSPSDSPFFVESKPETPAFESTIASQQPQPTSMAVQSQHQEQYGNQISRAVTPSRSPPMIDFDARMNGVLHQLAPFQLQQLLASLASQTITDSSTSSSVPTDTINPSTTSTLTQYQPPVFDFSQPSPIISPDGLISFNQYDPQPPGDANHSIVAPGQQHEPTMQKQWQGTEDIDKDVNAINTTINSFIQTFGLDPTLLEGVDHNESPPTLSSSTGGNNPTMAPSNSDFDFDMFLNNLSGSGQSGSNTAMDYGSIAASSGVGDLTNTSFLDEVHTPAASSDMTASPVQSLRQVSPEITLNGASTTNDDSSTGTTMTVMNAGGSSVGTGSSIGKSPAGKKRKSDLVVDFDSRTSAEATNPSSGGKSKKRKDK